MDTLQQTEDLGQQYFEQWSDLFKRVGDDRPKRWYFRDLNQAISIADELLTDPDVEWVRVDRRRVSRWQPVR